MKPKIEAISNGRNVYFVHVNGVQIGSELRHPLEAIQIEYWLRESWPDIVRAVNHNPPVIRNEAEASK